MRRYLDGEVDKAYPQQTTLEETADDADGESACRSEPRCAISRD